MDHYVPKRRVPVSVWLVDGQSLDAFVFLDLDPAGSRHQTVLSKLNEGSPFLPVSAGEQGRVELLSKGRIVRVTGRDGTLQTDLYTRGFQAWREEESELWLNAGESIRGRVWMPLERPTQRLSDYMNQLGHGFFVVIGADAVQVVSAGAVTRMRLEEPAHPGTAVLEAAGAARSLDVSRLMPMPAFDPTLGLGGASRR